MEKLHLSAVLVTGGGQGIGRAIAQAFAAKGYCIVMLEKDKGAMLETAQAIEKLGASHYSYNIDISDEVAVQTVFDDLMEKKVALKTLINNAGISRATPLDSPIREWDEVIGVNLRGMYLVTKYARPLLGHGSSIINIASTRATMSEPDWHAYAASKGGVVALTHSLAVSLGDMGIRVNSISPGWIDVSAWKKLSMSHQTELSSEDHRQHPAGRVGKPEDIAEACLFLASDGAGFITGANLVVDGGMTVKMIYAE